MIGMNYKILNNKKEKEKKKDKIIYDSNINNKIKDNNLDFLDKNIKIIENIEQKIVNYETNSNTENR